MIKVTIPQRFVDDHFERELGEGIEVLKSNSKGYLIEGKEEDLIELLSDAVHYSDCVGWSNDSSMLGLQKSAQATAKRLRTALDDVDDEEQ